MTDNEIIKALRCCSRTDKTVWCPDCPLFGREDMDCLPQKAKAALDLINRQKAEIERLQVENEIKSQKRANIFEIIDAYGRGKNEAIKEFADRLKKIMVATHKDINGYCHYRTEDCDIDNLVKEMTEQRKEDEKNEVQ